jgi:hypothetical protein
MIVHLWWKAQMAKMRKKEYSRLRLIEQFRDECARAFATNYFLTGLRELFTQISELIHLCDREQDKTEEAMAQIEAFSRHFYPGIRTGGRIV